MRSDFSPVSSSASFAALEMEVPTGPSGPLSGTITATRLNWASAIGGGSVGPGSIGPRGPVWQLARASAAPVILSRNARRACRPVMFNAMPLFEMDQPLSPGLYIVATPIGNLGDL